MAADSYGTAHLFGIGFTYTGCTITGASFEQVCALMAQVEDESGIVIERRYDDITNTGKMTVIQRSAFTMPEAGNVITADAIKWEVLSVGRTLENKGFRIVEVSLKNSAGITLP